MIRRRVAALTFAALGAAAPAAAVQVFAVPASDPFQCSSCALGGGVFGQGAFTLSGSFTVADGVENVGAANASDLIGFDLTAIYAAAPGDPAGLDGFALTVAGDADDVVFAGGASLLVEGGSLCGIGRPMRGRGVAVCGAEGAVSVRPPRPGLAYALGGRLVGPAGVISNVAFLDAGPGPRALLTPPTAPPNPIPLPATVWMALAGAVALAALGRRRG